MAWKQDPRGVKRSECTVCDCECYDGGGGEAASMRCRCGHAPGKHKIFKSSELLMVFCLRPRDHTSCRLCYT